MAATSGPERSRARAGFGLGISLSPSWTNDREIDRVAEVASIAARSRASVFLIGDKPGQGPDVRSNAVLLGWLSRQLVGVPRVGALFLVRQLPVESLLATARTLGELIRKGGSTPIIGVMRGRQRASVPMPGPDVGEAASALRTDTAIPEMELWVGAEQGAAIDRAARLADTWLANAYFDDQSLTDQVRRFRAAAQDAARTAVRRDFVCHRDSSEAHAAARRILSDGYRGGRFDESVLIAGSPAECLERMSAVAGMGFDDVLVRPAAEGREAVEQFEMLFESWTRT